MTTAQKKRKAPPKCNGLDGKQWLKNSISVWSDLTRTAEEKKLKHPAMFPVALARRLIDTFTPEGPGVVLDPFAGSGTTLVAAEEAGKSGIGFELSPEFANIAWGRLNRNGFGMKPMLFNESCSKLGDHVQPESCDLCVTSPPYWDILNQKRSADLKAGRNYGNLPGDLGNEESYVLFLDSLELVFRDVYHALKRGAYCCVVVMDIRKKDKFFQFHADVAARLQKCGFKFDDLVIWDRRADYNNLKPLGYPSVFRVNKVHEFIVIAQKPK
jgi:DNA modification methylase